MPFCILNIENERFKTVFDILKKLNIKESEIIYIFVNCKCCGPWKEVKKEDQIGLFPKKIALMIVEISKNNTIAIAIKILTKLQKYGSSKLKSIMQKKIL